MISRLFAFPSRAFIVAAVLPIQCANGTTLPDPRPAFEAASSVHQAFAASTGSEAWPFVLPSTDSTR